MPFQGCSEGNIVKSLSIRLQHFDNKIHLYFFEAIHPLPMKMPEISYEFEAPLSPTMQYFGYFGYFNVHIHTFCASVLCVAKLLSHQKDYHGS